MSGWFVTANDITAWTATDKRRAEEVLPLLIKKLVHASCKPKEINFPSGDSVAVSGWDGILDVEEGNEFVPTGKSGWELSTNSGVKKKADSDYEKRTKKPDPLTLDESTFVFVTSRLWSRKDLWVRNKKASGRWKDIKGINADTIEAWLARCPAVHRWFASVIGKRTGYLWDLEQAWSSLSNVTQLALSFELFIISRQVERDKFINDLTAKASIIRIKAQSKLEAHGFILASLMSRDEYIARVLFVKNQTAWDWLIEFDQPLIMIPDGFIPSALGSAVTKGHHVVIATDLRDSASASITLNRMPRQDRISGIQSIGLSNEEAERIYSDTKGYLEPILRHASLGPKEILLPQWVHDANPDVLFATFFATEWNADNDKDKEAIASLAGIEYEECERDIVTLSKESDPPVRLVGNVWQVISKVDMWLRIAPRIAKVHLDRLGTVAKLVLTDPDPSFDLQPDERYMASIKGAVPVYSWHIKTGLADSLALLAAYGDDYAGHVGPEKPSDLVRWWVRTLFKKSVYAKVWYSLDRCLESIAEAAPDEFLQALERSMEGDNPSIEGLFLAEGDGVFGGCPHSHLLWSLELISWDTRYVSRVSSCLACLSEIDPGGTYGNRPFNSLVDIFLGWTNNTRATHQQRIQIIEKVLLIHHPDVAWRLMVSLLINNTRTTSGVSKPVYREWAEGIDRTVLTRDYYKYVSSIVNILFREVDKDPGERVVDLIDNFNSYDKGQREAAIDYLIGMDVGSLQDRDKEKILQKLRSLLSHHREFPDAGWSWPEDLLSKLEDVYHRFEVEDVIKKNVYLFNDHWPDLIDPISRKEVNYKEREHLLTIKRTSAIVEIIDSRGIDGLADLASACNYPGMVGFAVFRSSFSEEAAPKIVDWLGSNEKLSLLAQSYVSARSVEDPDWATAILADNKQWKTNKKVSLLRGLPIGGRTFDLVEKQDEKVQREYWSGLGYYFLPANERSKACYVARKLLENNRPLAAIDAVAKLLWGKLEAEELESGLVASILIRIATDPADIDRISIQNVRHDILKAIEFIQDRAELSDERIAQIEWAYLKIFRYETVNPRYLSKQIAKDPSFFAQLVSWVFHRDEGEDIVEDLSEDIIKQRAEAAYELLDTVSVLPGSEGGTINTDELNDWVDQARQMLRKAGRLKIGDDRIGYYLSRCGVGSDGIWPHEEVRSVIEKVRSVELDQAIQIGRMNLRGVTSRSPFAGGEQERVLAKNYKDSAKKVELIYPRTAEILRGLANSYEREALCEDRRVELSE